MALGGYWVRWPWGGRCALGRRFGAAHRGLSAALGARPSSPLLQHSGVGSRLVLRVCGLLLQRMDGFDRYDGFRGSCKTLFDC